MNRTALRALPKTQGAHFTGCVPDYPRDEVFQRELRGHAKGDEAWARVRARYST